MNKLAALVVKKLGRELKSTSKEASAPVDIVTFFTKMAEISKEEEIQLQKEASQEAGLDKAVKEAYEAGARDFVSSVGK
jgi:hypothetical protein